jgi:hypothetical protein
LDEFFDESNQMLLKIMKDGFFAAVVESFFHLWLIYVTLQHLGIGKFPKSLHCFEMLIFIEKRIFIQEHADGI